MIADSVEPQVQEHVDHILRPALPWREDGLTECGRVVTEATAVVTADEVKARIKRIGQQRTAFTVCMTCAGRTSLSRTWQQDPIDVLYRELRRVSTGYGINTGPAATRMTAELRAIAALIAAHRDEFDGYLSGLGDTVNLADARSRRRRMVEKGRTP